MPDIFSSLLERQVQILALLRQRPGLSSSQIQTALGANVAAVTTKRDLATLVRSGHLFAHGAGRGVTYSLTVPGKLFTPIDAKAFAALEPDRRGAQTSFSFELFPEMPTTLFSTDERHKFDAATNAFKQRAASLTDTIARREMERFVIELSWKSSRIEGNTYTLLDTERLIRDGVEAVGRPHDDAVMILNHKRAFEFTLTNRTEFQNGASLAGVDQVHRLLTEGLGVSEDIRSRMVGITGSAYRPLDNAHQIREALSALLAATSRAEDVYTAALIVLAGLSYVQPYEDGNKRTARLVANAILLASNRSPLSYRSTDEIAYREATLTFYETSSLVPLKDIFTDQYLFSAEQYGLRVQ